MPQTFTDMYKFGNTIGSGSDGTVSVAMHKLTRKYVAIKALERVKIKDRGM